MATERTARDQGQGFLQRWTVDATDVLQADLRYADRIPWNVAPVVVEVTTPSGATATVQGTIDVNAATFSEKGPAPDFWHKVADGDVAADQVKTFKFDDPLNGIRVTAAGTTLTVAILSPVNLDGRIAKVE